MFDFVVLIKNFWSSIIALFEQYKFNIAGYQVSYFTLIFGFWCWLLSYLTFGRGAKA